MTAWTWLALGGALLALEGLTPGIAFVWLALSAAATAGLVWLRPTLGWQAQLLLFGAGAVASVAGWFWWRSRRPPPADGDPSLNRRTLGLVGTETILTAPTGAAGHGRVRVGDGTWLADGPPLPAGARVRVTGARGAVLLVEAAGPPGGAAPAPPGGPAEARGSPASARSPM